MRDTPRGGTYRRDELLHGVLQCVRARGLTAPEAVLTQLVAAAALAAVLEAREAGLLARGALHVVVHCE